MIRVLIIPIEEAFGINGDFMQEIARESSEVRVNGFR